MGHHAMTDEQRQCLERDLTSMTENLDVIANLLRACYGDGDMTVIRAEEASGAVQRLVWAVERKFAKRQRAAG